MRYVVTERKGTEERRVPVFAFSAREALLIRHHQAADGWEVVPGSATRVRHRKSFWSRIGLRP